jgi:hypothetical protein
LNLTGPPIRHSTVFNEHRLKVSSVVKAVWLGGKEERTPGVASSNECRQHGHRCEVVVVTFHSLFTFIYDLRIASHHTLHICIVLVSVQHIWTFSRVYSMVIRVTTHASQHPSGSIFETSGQLASKLSFQVNHTVFIITVR